MICLWLLLIDQRALLEPPLRHSVTLERCPCLPRSRASANDGVCKMPLERQRAWPWPSPLRGGGLQGAPRSRRTRLRVAGGPCRPRVDQGKRTAGGVVGGLEVREGAGGYDVKNQAGTEGQVVLCLEGE